RAVAVSTAANDAARFGIGLQAERGWVRPHIAHPFPNIASHVLASVGADAFRETAAGQFPLRADERRCASLRVGRGDDSPSIDVRTVCAELISPRVSPPVGASRGLLPFRACRQSPARPAAELLRIALEHESDR